VPDIQSLTEKASFFQKSFDFWTTGNVWFVALAVILAFIVFFTQFMAVRRAKELSQAQSELLSAKDKQLDEDLKNKDLHIAEAKERASSADKISGEANLRAAKLEKEAANARLETERLKESIAWRTLSQESALALEKVLTSKPGSVNLRYMDGDPEALFLAIQISQILGKAKWQIAPGAVKPSNTIVFGISLPDNSSPDTQTLRDAFSTAKIPFSTSELPASGVSFSISTIQGAPTLMVGSKMPTLP
jgi:ABC-type multidrug transport system fused ATPase/permease subunit